MVYDILLTAKLKEECVHIINRIMDSRKRSITKILMKKSKFMYFIYVYFVFHRLSLY